MSREAGRAKQHETIRVRPMCFEDCAAVAALSTQLGYPSTPDQIERRFALVAEAPDARVWVAECGEGNVVGWIHLFGTRQVESDPGAEIGGLVVDESTRGRGIGRALLEAAESWARERGYRAISVRSNVVRSSAHDFYKSRGYDVTKSQFKFRKTL
jgi:GNAT superfamily N-acetyltransferase